MELNYKQCGDYLIPDLVMDEAEPTYGKYGRLRKRYLQQHRRGLYNALLLQGKLIDHLNSIDAEARSFVFRYVKELAKNQHIDETLKARDPMAWVGAMNAIKHQAEEIALREFVYTENASII